MATALHDLADPAVLPISSTFGSWQRRVWQVIGMVVGLSVIEIQLRPWITTDFDEYHRAGMRVSAGESPYQLDDLGIWHTYRYPPAFAYLMIPLAQLDVAWAGRFWFACNWLMLGGCLALGLYLVFGPRPWPASASTLALISLGACSYYICANLYQGQVALAMTLTCLGWAACQRAGWRFSSGLLLAAGCDLKLAPIVLAPYLLVRKDWRGVAGLALGTSVFLLTPVPWVGVEGTIRMHQDWLQFVKDTQVPVHNCRPGNQGLMGMLARSPQVSNGDYCYSDANMATLQQAYPFVVAALFAAFYCWMARDCWRQSKGLLKHPAHQRDNLYLSLLFILMTITHPCAWRCNFVALLLPCLVLAQHACNRETGFAMSRSVLILVAMAWIWPVLLTGANLVRCWMTATADTDYTNMFNGRMPNENWSFAIWLLQGCHFWVAVMVGGVCCWVSGRDCIETSFSVRVATSER